MASSKETFKKIQSRIKKSLPPKIRAQISAQINNAQLNSKIASATRTAQTTAQIAAETAKHGIDQVLLNLEHRGLNIRDSQDLAVRVGRKVLERAEAIRAQIASNPLSPSWLKEVSLKPIDTTLAHQEESAPNATAAASMTEASVSDAAVGVSEPSHEDRASEALTAKKVRRPNSAGGRKSPGSSARTGK